jgi:hypothetical protein
MSVARFTHVVPHSQAVSHQPSDPHPAGFYLDTLNMSRLNAGSSHSSHLSSRIEYGTGQQRPQPRGQKSWALLARVALAERPLTRGELAAELFSDAEDPLAALRWCLADVRRCCDDPGLLRGDPVSLPAGSMWLDVRALWDGTLPAADIGGELLARSRETARRSAHG